jgi:hypothetical protein
MLTDHIWRRIAYVFLSATPFVAFGLAATRPLRIPGVSHVIGAVVFAAISTAAWTLGARAIVVGSDKRRRLAISGALLLTPFALVALLWVGIGAPPVATAAENEMRYLVLTVMVLAATGGLVALRETLSEAGERFYSTLGMAAVLLACPLYLVWEAFAFAVYFAEEHGGEIPPTLVALHPFESLLQSLSAALAHVATAAFAASLARTMWLSRKAARTYTTLAFIAVLFLLLKIFANPDPALSSPPWYTVPGFILGIPALPFIMPSLLGVVLLRRAGDEGQ